MRLQAEPLGLERDGAAAGERVEDRRRVAVGRLEDLRVRLGEERLVADVLPHDEPLDDLVQPLALDALILLGREPVRMRRRVVDKLREEHRPGSGERPPRPPQVQRRRVAVPDRLLPGRLPVDRLQRQRHLDQLALRCPASAFVRSVSIRTAPGLRPRLGPVATDAGGLEVPES